MKSWYLVCYDIRDDRRLREVHKLMLGYGSRIQYSIFRCWLNSRDIERMKWELAKLLDEEDNLLIAELCRKCAGKIRINGRNSTWSDNIPGYKII